MEEAKARIEKQLEALFSALRRADAQLVPESVRFAPKFFVTRVEEIEIRMDGSKNHPRGHIHVRYQKDGSPVPYAIDDGSQLAGDPVPSHHHRTIRCWISENRKDLQILWVSMQQGNRNEAILLKFQTTVYD